MKINVKIPYENAEYAYTVWAHEEKEIDFDTDLVRAERCTLSYAAEELVTWLTEAGLDASVSDSACDLTIELSSDGGEGEEFSITGDGKCIKLAGVSRKATLYAVYELLEANGFRWYSPGNEYVPKLSSLKLPEKTHFKYDMPYGRGYHFEGLLKESFSIITWMARNRMSLAAPYAHSVPLLRKLGFTLKIGGHILGDIINPKKRTEKGELYLDAHRDFYGKRDGEITLENALNVQFCVSSHELLDVLSEAVIKKCENEWKDADILELAGFDTWGKSCACESCRRLGNGSDITLYFLSHVREALNEAHKNGRIRKNPLLTFDIYDGTDTMPAPKNPVPENLIEFGDYGMFCPILRCYEHNIFEPCARNSFYKECFEAWSKTGFKIAINEYYNVSKLEDLPILFTERMKHDVPYYIEKGAVEMGYMHFTVTELGVRRLNDFILYNLSRDRYADVDALKAKYFSDLYEKYAERVSNLYEKIEKAGAPCQSLRGWFTSVLGSLMTWDGKRPEKPFMRESHLGDRYVEICYEIRDAFTWALEELRAVRNEVIFSQSDAEMATAKNPHDVAKMLKTPPIIERLSEDIRGLIYGADVFGFMALCLDYYNSLYENRGDDGTLYEKIKLLGEKMTEYTYGVSYAAHIPERELRDALKRSQLNKLYYNILGNRKEI